MKYLIGTIAAIVLLALCTGYVGYRWTCDTALHAAVSKGDTMAWLRTDFHLSDSQLSEIRQMHDSYAGGCEEHCRMIQEATRARGALEAAHGDKAAVEAANERIQALRTMCEGAIAAHVRKVASLMSPADGRRYLALILPKIANFDHTAPPDLRLGHSN